MRRRTVLASVGVLASAGCSGPGGDGRETTTTERTTTTAGSVAVTGSSLRITDVGCGTADDGVAAVAFGDDSVSVTGTVVGNNGCYRARLGDVAYESTSDTCRIEVVAFDDHEPGEACVECLTAIDYEASVSFEGGLPGTVEVVHDDVDGRSTVATASR